MRGRWMNPNHLSADDGLQIGATDSEAAGQHFNLLQQSSLYHSPEGRATDAK